ncbi:lysophospholipid acyltransferase family protein [Aggregatilinea lenta]|uniref:lysophospholipid acyltransferase family protein n=1 Tax=Aggregatilinea lenta TaxID=913108 RepID=UPI000E5C55F3|nr:lysophospholipid acyltransferase family protein [Aggregatilinea lenta]
MSNRVRYFYRRQISQRIGRVLQAALTRTTITGLENIPRRGPYIAVGNHSAAIEVALLVVNLPHVPELIGNGDVPFDPTFNFMAQWYRFIPIRRGHIDREALRAAREVLEQGNVLGIFPEGGIWDHHADEARPGVAWLSQQTGAPILPIGFGGMFGAIGNAMRLKRPRLSMSIGQLIPPVPNPPSVRERRAAINDASQEIMRRIHALMPVETRASDSQVLEERYAFRTEITMPDGLPVFVPPDLEIPYGEDLAYYFHHDVLLEVVYRNYKLLEAKPLSQYATLTDPAKLGAALDAAIRFYEGDPIFLGYRLGYNRAERVVEALRALRAQIAWAELQGFQVRVLPERTIMKAGGQSETLIAASVRRNY